MEFKNVVDQEHSSFHGVDLLRARDEVSHLGEAIHDNEDGIVSSAFGEANDKIEGDVSPWHLRRGERHEKSVGKVSGFLGSLADFA